MTPTIAIVHFNTPTLTRAEVMSIRKQCGEGWRIVIFDNSNVEPFQACDEDGITIFDNTRGQIIDFEQALAAYPSRKVSDASCFGRSIFGSVKHSMSVEWLMQHLDTPFILADSDILLKAPIDNLWDEHAHAVGYIETDSCYGNNRLQPYLCFINAPKCRRLGIHYFDPLRTWQLGTGKTEKENWYDTGASFYEDLQHTDGTIIKRVTTSSYMVHLGGASYLKTRDIPEWLFRYRELWNPDFEYSGPKTYISTIKMENVKVVTQDGRQFHLTADPGYLLRAKDTGDVVKVANTLRLDRWEVIPDPNAQKHAVVKGSKKKVSRKRKGVRYAVLCYIFDGYEPVREVLRPDPEAEYVMVTDNPRLKSKTWRIVYDETLVGLSTFDKCYRVRFRPFRYTDAKIVVRLDGSIQLVNPLTPVIDEFERGKYDLCVMIHPERNNIPQEYDVWVSARHYPRTQADKCIAYMKEHGYDFKYKGLYEGAFTIHRKNRFNRQYCQEVFDIHVALGTPGKIERLDQTITSYVLNSKYADKIKVMAVSRQIIHTGEFMRMHYHKSFEKMPIVVPVIRPYLFNKVVETKW